MAENKPTQPAKPDAKAGADSKSKPDPKAAGKRDEPPGLSRRNVFIAFVIGLSVLILVWRHYIEPTYFANYRAPSGDQAVKVETSGLPTIGGPFTLVNQEGKTVTDADFHGQYILVYFGYTYCPDVCPTSLTLIADALDLLGDKAQKVTPIFITIDPERDDPASMKMYIEHFHPRLQGLTGTPEQIKAVAKSYKAYYAKVGDGYDDGDYSMDHSSITYLMGPDGKFVTHFGHGTEPEIMAKKLAEIL